MRRREGLLGGRLFGQRHIPPADVFQHGDGGIVHEGRHADVLLDADGGHADRDGGCGAQRLSRRSSPLWRLSAV